MTFLDESLIREVSESEIESYDIHYNNDSLHVDGSDDEVTQHHLFEEGRERERNIEIEIEKGSEEVKHSETSTKKITLNQHLMAAEIKHLDFLLFWI